MLTSEVAFYKRLRSLFFVHLRVVQTLVDRRKVVVARSPTSEAVAVAVDTTTRVQAVSSIGQGQVGR